MKLGIQEAKGQEWPKIITVLIFTSVVVCREWFGGHC